MSNAPGISPITPDIEDVRHSEGDDVFGEHHDDDAPEEPENGDDEERS